MKKKQKKTPPKKTKFELSAGGIVYNKNSKKVLIIKDPRGRFSFPKGRVEEREAVLNAAKREVAEETGVKKLEFIAKLGEIKYFYNLKGEFIFKKVVYFFFETTQKKLTIQKEEIKDAFFIGTNQLTKKISFKNILPIIKEAQKIISKNYD